MGEKCKYAYRKRGMKAVFCKQISGEKNFCAHQYMCWESQRWEANKAVACTLRTKKPNSTQSTTY